MKALGSEKGSLDTVREVLQKADNNEEGVLDVLEAVVAWARSLDLNPEILLRARTEKRIQDVLDPAQ